MRVVRFKRVMFTGLVAVSVVMFYQYLMWQLRLSGALPLLGSSQRLTYNRLKQKLLFTGDRFSEKKCMSSSNVHENITTSNRRRPVNSRSIDDIIAASGLDLEDAFQSDMKTVFSPEALMISGLPQFTARIPAIVSHRNVFLAFCEARFEGVHDVGEMMVAMRRGHLLSDGDIKWDNVQLIAGVRTFRTMNPSPIVDRVNDAIVLVFAGFPSSMSFNEMMGFSSFPLSKLYVMVSYDLGASWSDQMDITSQTILRMHPNPVLLVPGPGHSIQMECGRIIVPVNYFTRDENSVRIPAMCQNCTNYNRIIYSDDGGLTWEVGKRSKFMHDATARPIYLNEVQKGNNQGLNNTGAECEFSPDMLKTVPDIAMAGANFRKAVEVDDNTVCLNSRTLTADHPRATTLSRDGGRTLSPSHLIRELVEPGYKRDGTPMAGGGCAGSVIGFEAPRSKDDPHSSKRWVLFSNPADKSFRINLSLRLSIDGCRTWSKPFRIYDLKSAYSDLAFFEARINGRRQRMVVVIYEGGGNSVVSGGMKLRMFNLEAILSGIRSVTLGEWENR